MQLEIVRGDLLEQPVEVIVNAWNRNMVPWRLLRPHGVSGAIKRRAGTEPFREVARHGRLALGAAVWTGAGRLPYRGIIHVAAINLWGRSSPAAIRAGTCNALAVAQQRAVQRIAFPLLGAGSGGMAIAAALDLMREGLRDAQFDGLVLIVEYGRVAIKS